MKDIEVLVVTMNQKDFEIVSKMKIKSNAIIANQTDRFGYSEINNDFGKVKMINTNTKGVGLNRNFALLYSEAEYILFADDDEVLCEGYEEKIVEAFAKVPSADILIFNINTISDKNVDRRVNDRIKKINFLTIFNYGAVRIAIKKSSLLRANISFTHLFGGGAKYSAGEDSMFLKKCLFNGMKIYTYPLVIADVYQFESTWFNGYNEKYFYDKGCWVSATFRFMKTMMCILFVVKTYSKCEISLFNALKLALAGSHNFSNDLDYDDWRKRRE